MHAALFYFYICMLKVPLGVLAKNENKGDDMVEIMYHIHRYVPLVDTFEETEVETESGATFGTDIPRSRIQQVIFGGDQLTAARARGAQAAKTNSFIPCLRLDGIIPCAEDWHTKLNFLEVCVHSLTISTISYIYISAPPSSLSLSTLSLPYYISTMHFLSHYRHYLYSFLIFTISIL